MGPDGRLIGIGEIAEESFTWNTNGQIATHTDRAAAAYAIGLKRELGGATALLERALDEDEEQEIRRCSSWALGLLRAEGAIGELSALLRGKARAGPWVRGAAAAALARMPAQPVAREMIEVLAAEGVDDLGEALSIAVLGRVLEDEVIPFQVRLFKNLHFRSYSGETLTILQGM